MADSLSSLSASIEAQVPRHRAGSVSQASENSQTAQQFISSQLQLEADAREALPYQFDTCTRSLGPLRQLLFSCLTCNPPPDSPDASYTPAGVCYSCSISCHGEHTLVELFNKRSFVCDCGTTRLPSTSPCTLRADEKTQEKGNVHSEKPAESNKYNHNFGNKFCGCGEDYNPHQEKGTMFQCIGLGSVEDGGCGEDWWHPECLVGLPRGWWKEAITSNPMERVVPAAATSTSVSPDDVTGEPIEASYENDDLQGEPPLPPAFPAEDDFDGLICYKCVTAFPWIRRYAGTDGFLAPIYNNPPTGLQGSAIAEAEAGAESRKRKALHDGIEDSSPSKRQRGSSQPEDEPTIEQSEADVTVKTEEIKNSTGARCTYLLLPGASEGRFSICLEPDFRDHFCRCPEHFPLLTAHPQLLEEEDVYEPPISEADDAGGPGSAGSKSLLDRGEAALNNVDRVRAIEGVMVYNHLRDKVKDFLKPFAESGTAVGAEDIKKYFETLRGDAEAIKGARQKQMEDGESNGGDRREEQGGY